MRRHCHVELAVAVKVSHCNGTGARPGCVLHMCLETAITIADQHANGSRKPAARGVDAVIRNDHVEVTVSVEITHGDRPRILASYDVVCGLECTIAIVKQDAHMPGVANRGIA